jgi:phosphoglycolate phosphatase/pyrophosphatase PpaX
VTPEAILFDLDGTLIDTYHLYLESYRRALQPYLGYSPGVDEFTARYASSERRFLADWIGEERAAECQQAMCEHYARLHASLAEGLYDGVREMLSALRAAGVPLGIVTGKGRQAWETTSAAIDLGDFRVVITDNDVLHPKPHPGGLLAAARELGADPATLIYVGDSIADMEAGRAAGVPIGAALWPKTDPDDRGWFLDAIRPHRPDWIFERPADVTYLFASWC